MEKLDIHIVGLGNLGSAFLKGLNNVEDINLFLYDDLESVRNSVNNEFSIIPKDSIISIQNGVVFFVLNLKI